MGSVPSDGPGPLHERIGSEFAEELIETLRPIAAAKVRVAGLGRFAEDLFQEAFRRCWEELCDSGQRPTQRRCDAVVHQVATEVVQEWRRVATHSPTILDDLGFRASPGPTSPATVSGSVPFDPVRAPPKGVPRLGRRLMSAAWSTRYERRLARAIRSAAHLVALRPGVLLRGSYRIFMAAYGAGWAASEVADMLGISERAANERLGRISQRIENHLIERMRERDATLIRGPDTPDEDAGAMKKNSIFVTATATETCVRAILALRAILPENRGSSNP